MTKAELIQAVETQQGALISLVSDLIKIPSENPTGSQAEVIQFVRDYLSGAGIASEQVETNPTFPCVLASIGQAEGFQLIVNGHVDVVPAGDRSQWNFDPYSGEITETQVLGRGTSDMKAGVAGALFAMRLMKQVEARLQGAVRLHIVSDEESGGQYGTEFLCARGDAAGADACLVAEPTSMNTIEIGQKGRLALLIRAKGVSAHGSLGGFVGDNAIVKMGKLLPYLSRLTEVQGHFSERQAQPLLDSKRIAAEKQSGVGVADVIDHVTCNVGLIRGGTKINMVADACEVEVDCRLPIGVDRAEVEAVMAALVEESGLHGISYTMNFNGFGNFTDHEADIVTAVRRNAESFLGHPVVPAYQWASSDASDYRALGIPTIQFGPSNTEGIHSYNETVEIADVITATKTYVAAMCDLLGID